MYIEQTVLRGCGYARLIPRMRVQCNGMAEKRYYVRAAKRELLDKLKVVIAESADEIISKTLNKLSESPAHLGERHRLHVCKDICLCTGSRVVTTRRYIL